jgi:hypothetical protein
MEGINLDFDRLKICDQELELDEAELEQCMEQLGNLSLRGRSNNG